MKLIPRSSLIVSLISLFSGVASAQVITGTPPFGSFGGGPVDTINLANLNAHISIPVLQKAGRGIPFNYNITYDSSIWTPSSASGSLAWEPADAFGWAAVAPGYGLNVFQSITGVCYTGHPVRTITGYDISFQYQYTDASGTPHTFPGYQT